MSFASLPFLAFFALVALIHWSPAPTLVKKLNLVLASYFFYASWTLAFLPLLWLTTAVDFTIARRLAREERPARRRALCALGVTIALAILAGFKYRAFIANSFIALGNDWLQAGIAEIEQPESFPLGLSFYTFESIAYLVDVQARRCAPARGLLDYALFISFFPHLMSGPIVRPGDFLPQCDALRRPSRDELGWGLALITLGLFLKVAIADQMAPLSDRVFQGMRQGTALDLWSGSLAFCMQIYCDFAGYTSCAIGMALCLGLVLNQNFDAPYAAIGLRDFWWRWHISLSSWLRDYLYVPLGGNRLGRLRTAANLMTTMLLGGLWHGASWTFVAWGGAHGAALVVERVVAHGARNLAIAAVARPWISAFIGILTFLFVDLTWVLFRSRTLADAGAGLGTMLLGSASGARALLAGLEQLEIGLVAAAVLIAHWSVRRAGAWAWWGRRAWWQRSLLLTAMIVLILVSPRENREFIYFQF